MQHQGKSRRKYTGGRRITARGKRKFEQGREAAEPHINKTRRKIVDTLGGNRKIKLLRCDVANITDLSTNTTRQVPIDTVVDNAANQHYIRRNILTKGSIIKTGIGNAKITSRPGQDGIVNAILINN